jgi:hypothetical protein
MATTDLKQRHFCGLLAFAVSLWLAATGQAQQRGVEPAIKTGTLVEVAQKGRVQTLTYTDEAGEEQSLILNAKIQSYVEAPGDAQFLRPGQFIATLATESNGQLFAKEVTVVLVGKGRPPVGRIQKAPPKPGQSMNTYQVTGAIAAIGADKDYPQYQKLEIQATGPRAPLMLEQDVQVTVRSMDFGLAMPGTPLELEGTELKNGRFVPTRVAAKLEEPLQAEDVFGAADSPKGDEPPQKPAEN